jgi:hypothetical protein
MEKAKGNQICNQLIKQKIDLGLENQRIRHQINKLEIKKIRYKNLLDLLKSIKYGLNNSKTEIMSRNHITNKHKKISLSETNNNNKKNNFKKFFYINKIRRNSRNMNTNTFQQEKNQNKMLKKNQSVITNDVVNKEFEDIDKNKPLFENEEEISDKLKYLEKLLLNNIHYYNQLRYDINELKKELEQEKKSNNDNDKNDLVLSMIEIVEFLKKENDRLKQKIKLLIQNNSTNIIFNKYLEQKLLNILKDINNEFNIEEKLSIKNLFFVLNLESGEFTSKTHDSKTLYMIKIIEQIEIYFFNLNNRYLNEPKSKEIFKNVLNIFEKEKAKQYRAFIKEELKENIIKKKIDIMTKANKIRFCPSRGTIKNLIKDKSKKHKSKRKTRNRNDLNHHIYEKWISYG